ncbi:MAG TPA: branched-chain amino acid transaminase [Candidatus Saccharimonadales bacterium]|nr:branched-chain amino acid transaminase [Candidatus Saccharimonadales bacterium]
MPAFIPYPYAYFQKKIVSIEDAQISVMTNGLHYGVGIYGGFKAFEKEDGVKIFRLKDHLKRMEDSVAILKFPFDFDKESVEKTVLELARKNSLSGTSYIRPLVYRSDTMLSPDIAGEYDLAIYMMHMPEYFDAEKGIEVCISRWRRNSDDSIPPRTKATGGYINSALAINDAHLDGYDSAIMLDKNGDVSEGAVMNIFLVRDDKLITPSMDSDILEGITRRTVLELAGEMGIEVEERKVKKEELFDADEVFFTGTAANVTWCRSIDKNVVSEKIGPLTARFVSAFSDLDKTHPQYFTGV